jgi:HAD superfamily hydrolase (TIGR01509 family)
MFEAVIFDWDGTLADTRDVLVISFKKALHSINCEVSDELIERRIGIGVVGTFQEILKDKNVTYDNALIQRLLKTKVQTEISLSKQINLFDGAQNLLAAIYGKTKIALATMNQREFIEHTLKEKSIQNFFQVILTANEVNKPKPDPEIFLKTALQLGVKPEKCVVLEDSIFGVKAAKAANMGCIAIAQGAYSPKELAVPKPDLVVGSLKEKDIILNLIFQ